MVKRIAAILFIFACTSVGWAILGSTIFYRTYGSDSELRGRVVSTWGAPQEQKPPAAHYSTMVARTETTIEDGKRREITLQHPVDVWLLLEGSDLNVGLELEHRQKGLLWYSTYRVTFAGNYIFRNPSPEAHSVTFTVPLPAAQAVYDGLAVTADGKPLETKTTDGGLQAGASVEGGKTVTLHVAYHSQGLDSWKYAFGGGVASVNDFRLRVTTNFKAIDFPENTLSPTTKRETPDGWELVWNYKSLLSGYEVGVTMPEKLQPGPLAGRISYFAPVSLFFFFFVMFMLTTLREIELHPMNYFFLGAAFFAFHLLLAYLVDHISVHVAFVICSLVSIFLVVSYLRVVIGLRFAAVEAGLAQLIYLVLFSYAFFFQGFTGLAITIGAIVTLFVAMQMTARVRWAERFRARTA